MNTDRPLDGLGSIKVKLGLLVVASVLAATVLSMAGDRAGVSGWLTTPVAIAGSLLFAQWLARGMTSPLREMTAAAERMATGDYSGRVSATGADEVGALAQAFNTMAADLGSVDQQRRDLIATVSHELRTPLTAQQALLENLVDGVVQPDDAALGTALQQSERLGALVSDLLDLSRIDAGQRRLELAPVDLRALVEQHVAEAAASRPVTIETDIAELAVTADAGRLGQVLANLLDNAARHSPPDGVVRVVCAAVDDDRWSLEVSDQGEGIPADASARVFDRFGTTTDAATGGTGLGLAIARWVCELHGGSIDVVPSTTGARVRAVLPLLPQQKAEPMPTTTPQPTPTPPPPPTPPAAVEPAPVIAPLFGGLWPERNTAARPALVLAAIGIGVLAGLLLPHRPIGVATLLVLLVAGGTVLRVSVNRGKRWSQVFAATAIVLSFMTILRAAEWLTMLSVGIAGVLLMVAVTDAKALGAMVGGWLSWVLAAVRGLPLLGRSLDAMSRVSTLWPALRTIAISLAALVIFGGLFASGDAIFGSWVSALVPDLNVDGFVERGFVAFVVAGVVLAASYVAINPPAINRLELPPGRHVARPWEWQVPVGIVIALFAAFVAAQATAMFGGHDYVERTTGLTYADYVHQGFGQLTFATFLTLLTVALAARKAPRSTPAEQRIFRGLLGTLCVLALVVVGSALHRMSVYQEAYGYTVLRVLVDAFELWMGLVLVLVLIAGIRLDGRWVPRVALLSGALMVLALGIANPEAWVAQRNIDRYEATGTIDTWYLYSLGADAAPTIDAGLPAELTPCSISPKPDFDGGFLNWNLGRSQASSVHVADLTDEASERCMALAE